MSTQNGPEYDVPSDEWIEIISRADAQAALGDAPDDVERDNGRFDVRVRDNAVFLSHDDKISKTLGRGPYPPGVSGPLDPVGRPVYARAQDGVASVSADREGFIFAENSVTVDTTIAEGYANGASFDTGSGDTFPVNLDPDETINQLLLPTVEGEITVIIETTAGDTITIAVLAQTVIDSYSASSVTIEDPNGNDPRVSGAWAGE